MEVASSLHRVDELNSVFYFEGESFDAKPGEANRCSLTVQTPKGEIEITGSSAEAVFEAARKRFQDAEPKTWEMIGADTEFMRLVSQSQGAHLTMSEDALRAQSHQRVETIIAS
jgi:hypothetical protein